MTQANGIQIGTGSDSPIGEMNQSRFPESVTSRPSGTLSLAVWIMGKAMSTPTIVMIEMGRPKSPRARRIWEIAMLVNLQLQVLIYKLLMRMLQRLWQTVYSMFFNSSFCDLFSPFLSGELKLIIKVMVSRLTTYLTHNPKYVYYLFSHGNDEKSLYSSLCT